MGEPNILKHELQVTYPSHQQAQVQRILLRQFCTEKNVAHKELLEKFYFKARPLI